MTRLLPFALLGLAFACNGDAGDDTSDTDATNSAALLALEGLWQTQSQKESPDCTTEEEILPIPFFRLEVDGTKLGYIKCRSETDCDSFPDPERFFEVDGNALKGVSKWTFFNGEDPAGGTCSFNARQSILTQPDASALVIKGKRVEEAFVSPDWTGESDCTRELDTWVANFASAPFECETIQALRVDDGTSE